MPLVGILNIGDRNAVALHVGLGQCDDFADCFINVEEFPAGRRFPDKRPDAADDLAYQPARNTVGLDQYQGPFSHGAQRTEPGADQPGG